MAQNGKKGGGKPKKATSPKPEKITFDYIKSNYFRVISVNGVFGGLSPNGDIHMAVWSQRKPYPKQVVHELTEEGIGEEIERSVREADIIREIEAGLVFNPSMARAMIDWLEEQLRLLSGIIEARGKATEES